MSMINEELREYLDLKFGDVITEIKQHSKDIPVIERKVEALETFKTAHEKFHDKADSKNQFTIGQIIVVVAFIATILADKFL